MSNDHEEDTGDFDEVTLKYHCFYDTKTMSVYLKFNGFSSEEEMNNFIDYVEPYIPLILFNDKVKH